MNAEIVENKKVFTPFKVLIDIETEEEAQAMFALALTNTSVPQAVVKSCWSGKVKDATILVDILTKIRNAFYKAGYRER